MHSVVPKSRPRRCPMFMIPDVTIIAGALLASTGNNCVTAA
jgi:hypothetical protein